MVAAQVTGAETLENRRGYGFCQILYQETPLDPHARAERLVVDDNEGRHSKSLKEVSTASVISVEVNLNMALRRKI